MPISLSSSPSYSVLNLKTRLHSPLYLTTVKRHRLWSPTPTKNYNADFQEILPGKYSGHLGAVQVRGSWWNLPGVQASESSTAKPVTVSMALKRIWGLIGDDNWIVFLALGALFIAAVSEISMPRILAASVFSANSGESAAFSRSSRMLILLLIISGICSGLRSGCFAMANTILVKRLRRSLYAYLVFQDISFFDMETVGSLTSRLGSDCQRLSHVIGNDIHLIIRNAIQGTGALINLLTLSWPLTLPTLIICSVLAIIFSIYGRYQKRAAKLMQEFNACANNVAQETLSLMRTVRAYGTEGEEVERYKRWLDELAFVSIRESAAYGLWSTSFLTLYRFTQVLAVLLGGICIMNSQLSPEQLTKYILYCEWLIYATWRVVDNSSSLLQSIGACEKVFHLMDLLPTDQFLSKGVKLPRLMGNIQFVNVSFHYPSRISIYMDGLPLDELDIRWLRENIGFVGQEPDLFNMDVKSNIKYGCPREVKDEGIEWAAKQAHAHEFISSLPHGYQTIVDNDLLSGGQRQRIAIARAMLPDPAILVLDEATSALDAESEHYLKGVFHGLRNESRSKRTIILIAHRLSTIKTADRIVVMDKGQIIEMGDHTELLQKGGLYSRLIGAQAKSMA